MGSDEVTTGAYLLGEPLPVEMMNTVRLDCEGVHDALASDAEVAWLRAVGTRIGAEAGIVLDRLGEESVRPAAARIRGLRDAVRTLAAENRRPPATAPGLTRLDSTTVDLTVGLIANRGVEFSAGPGRDQLRVCLAPNWPLFFVKEHARREWCSAGCGTRARVVRHYGRHHATRPDRARGRGEE